jgi:hypothetical protein
LRLVVGSEIDRDKSSEALAESSEALAESNEALAQSISDSLDKSCETLVKSSASLVVIPSPIDTQKCQTPNIAP